MPGGLQTRFLLAGDKECILVRAAVPRLLLAVLGGSGLGAPSSLGSSQAREVPQLTGNLSVPCAELSCLCWPSAEAVLRFSTHIHPLQSVCHLRLH